ncbi:MAG: hypothetical protein ACLUHE_06850 [Christensenellales bacterium]
MENPIVSWLFETDAVRVCPEGQPFWYTSGKLGPFYINTQFLYGSEEPQANALLTVIERGLRGRQAGVLRQGLRRNRKAACSLPDLSSADRPDDRSRAQHGRGFRLRRRAPRLLLLHAGGAQAGAGSSVHL